MLYILLLLQVTEPALWLAMDMLPLSSSTSFLYIFIYHCILSINTSTQARHRHGCSRMTSIGMPADPACTALAQACLQQHGYIPWLTPWTDRRICVHGRIPMHMRIRAGAGMQAPGQSLLMRTWCTVISSYEPENWWQVQRLNSYEFTKIQKNCLTQWRNFAVATFTSDRQRYCSMGNAGKYSRPQCFRSLCRLG